MHWLVTGGCGFIGSHFIRFALGGNGGLRVTNVDSLTYAGNRANLADVEADFGDRYRFIEADINDGDAFPDDADAVLNFAAESHVDRSIASADAFIQTNIAGTQALLDRARATGVEKFVQISTDEVYGSLGADGLFAEETPLAPNSPYSASKAAADLLARAAFHTHGQHVVVTRCSNNYGSHQFPEKLIPLMILNAMHDESLPVYGDGKNVRDWIHVHDHCRGIIAALKRGRAGEVYNFGSDNEWENIAIVREILSLLEKPESLIRYVDDRLGHDRRYAIDAAKSRGELGWRPEVLFERGLRETVEWYHSNRDWWEPLRRK